MFAAGANPFTQIRKDLLAFEKQQRFGVIVALTKTAQDVKAAEIAEIDRAIDRPTPYTRAAVYLQRATRERPVAAVGLKDDLTYAAPGHQPANYLQPQIDGGQRNIKAFEKLLQLAGLMPAGWKAVPGAAARLDQYGNVSRGQIVQVLSQLRLQRTAGYTRNLPLRQRQTLRGPDGKLLPLTAEQKRINAARSRAFARAGGRFFVMRAGESPKIPPGIYQRQVLGRKAFGPNSPFPKAVFVFVTRATYRKRFDWYTVAERTIEARLFFHLDAEIANAIATAR
jgi:hypothetical protein